MPHLDIQVLQVNTAGGLLSGSPVTFYLLFCLALLLLIVFVYVFWLNKKFKKENKELSDKLSERSYQVMLQKWELERKNMSISQQNKEIIESLHYAKGIQSSILPDQAEMGRSFKEIFILFKPKDIVSGDFYFFQELNNKVFLAVADCTGHGVAGAFMSLVGSSLLRQIIGQERVTDPAVILNELNEGIVSTLQQKESSAHGGMDIAFVCIDPAKKELSFAGANRPLVIIHNGETQQVSPDKLPIGGFQPDEDRRFNSQVVSFQPDDRVYLYTDGYADQFGGPDGKKIMTKKFKELLMSIHTKPMEEQRRFLNEYFENWRGKFEQVDDVLVIGIRL